MLAVENPIPKELLAMAHILDREDVEPNLSQCIAFTKAFTEWKGITMDEWLLEHISDEFPESLQTIEQLVEEDTSDKRYFIASSDYYAIEMVAQRNGSTFEEVLKQILTSYLEDLLKRKRLTLDPKTEGSIDFILKIARHKDSRLRKKLADTIRKGFPKLESVILGMLVERPKQLDTHTRMEVRHA